VVYTDQIPWPISADGNGASLQRIRASDFGNDVLNWVAATPTPLVFADGQPIDRDADGIPDVWEVAHGLDMYNPADAALDFDGDGASNLDEFQSGGDPFDPKDGFVAEVVWTADAPALEFNAAAGITYRLEFRDSLSSGAWQTHSTFGPFDSARSVSLPIIADGQSQRFYRIAK
jgi:hypothetical protein